MMMKMMKMMEMMEMMDMKKKREEEQDEKKTKNFDKIISNNDFFDGSKYVQDDCISSIEIDTFTTRSCGQTENESV